MTDEQLKIISDFCHVSGYDYHEVKDAIKESIRLFPISSGDGEVYFYVLYLYTHHYNIAKTIYPNIIRDEFFGRGIDGLHFKQYLFRDVLVW